VKQLFHGLVKFIGRLVFRILYRVDVIGLEHYQQAAQSDKPILIIANHVSLLDGPLLDLFVPGNTTFMVDKAHTKKWYEKLLLSMSDFFAVDMHSPYAAKHMIEQLKAGKQCMIFPEGRITTTGALMKIYDGAAMVAAKTDAQVLAVHIEGAQLSKLSYLDGSAFSYIKQRCFPKITLTIAAPKTLQGEQGVKGRIKHKHLTEQLTQIMRAGVFNGAYRAHSLYAELLRANVTYDAKAICVEDINDQALSLKKLNLAAKVLGHQLHQHIKDEPRVGLMLPNVAGVAASFFALQAYAHVPAMINFTAGTAAIRSACETAQLKTIITSQKFIDAFELHALVEALSGQVRFLLLEEVRSEIGTWQKVSGLLRRSKSLPGYKQPASLEAVVLFTSGSEGAPKGVVLSHQNILSNIAQVTSMLTLLPQEKIFNALPTFHSFGLTAGMLWPILKGARTYLYPSPLHYQVIPEMVYQTNSKILFGTDSFFNGYARKAHPYDFYSLRALVAGAERLRPETRQLFAEKFHQPIFEGYGVTETSPVLSVNVPTAFKHGSVGQFVPGVEHYLEEVPGITEGGRLWVKGPNVMLGYLMPDQPGVVQMPEDGWHDTGDIVDIDADGYAWIKGRAKRFAKIAGEMISLTAVESYINEACPDGHHVVVAVPDAKKGEQLVLVTDDISLNRQKVMESAKQRQLSELMIPKTVIILEQIPLLGTGKTNYPEVQLIAEKQLS